MKLALIRSALVFHAIAYAVALSTAEGRRWATRQTWATVVFGVAMTLGFLSLEDRRAARLATQYFIASGAPMIVRSLWLQIQERDEYLNHKAI